MSMRATTEQMVKLVGRHGPRRIEHRRRTSRVSCGEAMSHRRIVNFSHHLRKRHASDKRQPSIGIVARIAVGEIEDTIAIAFERDVLDLVQDGVMQKTLAWQRLETLEHGVDAIELGEVLRPVAKQILGSLTRHALVKVDAYVNLPPLTEVGLAVLRLVPRSDEGSEAAGQTNQRDQEKQSL